MARGRPQTPDRTNSLPNRISGERGTGRRLVDAILLYGLTGVVSQVVGFLLIPIYTRLLSLEDYGAAEVTATVGAVAFVVLKLGVGGSISRLILDEGSPHDVRSLVSSVFFFICAFALIAAGLVTWVGWLWLPDTLFGVPLFPLLLLVLWTQVLNVPWEILCRLRLAREQSRLHVTYTMARFIALTTLSLAFVLGFRWGVEGMFLAGFVDAIIFCVVSVVRLLPDLTFQFSWRKAHEALRYGVPMLPHHLSTWIMTLADRLLLGGVSGLETTGVYGIGARMTTPISLLSRSLAAAWPPIYFERRKTLGAKAEGPISQLATHTWGAALWLVVLCSVLADDVVFWLLPESYAPARLVVPLIALSHAGYAMEVVCYLETQYSKASHMLAVFTFSGACTSLAMNLLLIPRFGIVGAGLSACIGRFASIVLSTYYARRTFRLQLRWRSAAIALTSATFPVAINLYGSHERVGALAATGVTFLCVLVYPLGLWLLGYFTAGERQWVVDQVRTRLGARRHPHESGLAQTAALEPRMPAVETLLPPRDD